MEKTKLFIDFDGTIVNSVKSICELYNFQFKNQNEFIPAKWYNSKTYNMLDECKLAKIEDIWKMFYNPLFFENLEFYDNYTYDVLKELNEYYQLIVCSIGHPLNISMKSVWLHDNLPFVKDYVLISNEGCKMNKSIVNMNKSIFIDDVGSNLVSSNAQFKIIFGDIEEWNKDSKEIRCCNWMDIKRLLIKQV